VLYPTVSDYWNRSHASFAVTSYQETVSALAKEDYSQVWQSAAEFNSRLAQRENPYELSEELTEDYSGQLNLNGDGIMGYVEIPLINVLLPIYHGTDELVLQSGVGHLEWSSLPVGGVGSHCILSGHRGLPSAKLLTNLDRMAVGDVFMLHVLDEKLTYEVDQILIVLPTDIEALSVRTDMDYCTLVTCTPYGVNTHRLLVRGHRIDNAEEHATLRLSSDARQIESIIVMPVVAIPLLLLAIVLMLTADKKEHLSREIHKNDEL